MRFLADLALFVEVANTQNFGRAAAALGMPASTLSRRISALERELGYHLIHRSTRTFKLTEAGQACYNQSKSLVAEAARIQEDVANLAIKASGHIRVGLPYDLAQTIFAPLCARYMQQHPRTSVELLGISGHPNLIAESLDLAILVGHQIRLRDSSFPSRRIGTFPRRLFASQQYLAAHSKITSPTQLVDHPCIRLVQGEPLGQWELLRGRERITVKVTGVATANSVGVIAKLAKEGMGIAFMPDFLASDPAFGNNLTRILPDWEGVPAHLFAVTPSIMPSVRIRKFVTFLKDNFEVELDALTTRRRP